MMRLAGLGTVFILGCATLASAQQPQTAGSITLAAGTKLELAVTAPVWMKQPKPGDPLYLQTIFPVTVAGQVAIPAGTYVQGSLLDVTLPTRRNGHAQIDVLFRTIVFASEYAVMLPEPPAPGMPASNSPPATAVRLHLIVSSTSDVLLDNGTQLEMTLAAPLVLDAAQVAATLPVTQPVTPGSFRTASRCLPTSGTPGTSDTVIPGTPGTPSTTIPGGPGMPDIVIPGTPATPDTVIPGTPGTPGTSCPAPPMVTASEPLSLSVIASQSTPAH